MTVAGASLRRAFTGFTPAQWALLAGSVTVNVGTFAVYPYLALLLRERTGAGIATVGVVLGAATLVQFGGAPLTAALAERWGLVRALRLALLLYTLGGVAYLAGVDHPATAVLGLFLVSAAAALYSPAYRSLLVQDTTDADRARLVSAGNAASNLGIALGPVLGALLVASPQAMFAVVTVLYGIVGAGHLFVRSGARPADADPEEPLRRMLHGAALLPFVLTALTLYLHMQFYQYLSSYAAGRVPTIVYGAAMMIYSLGLVLVQPLVAPRVDRATYGRAVLAGFACMALGMVSFAAFGVVGLVVGVIAMSVGNAVLFLKNDLEALVGSRRSATVTFGQQRLAQGVGSFLSGVVGGGMYGSFESAGHLPWFWLVVAAQCVVLPPLVLGIARLLRCHDSRRTVAP